MQTIKKELKKICKKQNLIYLIDIFRKVLNNKNYMILKFKSQKV